MFGYNKIIFNKANYALLSQQLKLLARGVLLYSKQLPHLPSKVLFLLGLELKHIMQNWVVFFRRKLYAMIHVSKLRRAQNVQSKQVGIYC